MVWFGTANADCPAIAVDEVILVLALWVFRLPLGTTSSEPDEAKELHEPAPPIPGTVSSSRTGDAFRRIVSSINCLAQLKYVVSFHLSQQNV